MLAKKVWIPILIVLLAVVFSGLIYSQRTATQEPVTKIRTVETQQSNAPKPPPPGETHETGHWHGDYWHAAPPHGTPVAQPTPHLGSPVAPLQTGWFPDADGNWYPPDYTQGDIQADLAGAGAMTDEEYHRRAMKNLVSNYMRGHREDYPDCTEHEAFLADAIAKAEWVLVDQKYMDKYMLLTDQMTRLGEEMEQLFEKYNDRPFHEATHIPEAERRKDLQRLESLMADVRSNREQKDALNREKPPRMPKPVHTH